MMRWVVLMAVLFVGCADMIMQKRVRRTAALDHGCPTEKVVIARDATVEGDYAYWLGVCGRQRYYRHGRSGRFIDKTAEMR